MTTPARYRLSFAIEALLWIAVHGLLCFLAWDYAQTGSLRSMGEFVLLGLLIWWPMIRRRITHGYWMRGLNDDPGQPMTTPARDRLNLAIEAVFWIAVLGPLCFLAWDFVQTGSLRSLQVFVLFGLLILGLIARTMTTATRHNLSLALQALLWAVAVGWLVYLIFDIGAGVNFYLLVCGADSLHWAQGCPKKSLPWRSIFEVVLLGLLIWWPIIRARIKYGYWMRDWDDHPERHFSETGRPAAGPSPR